LRDVPEPILPKYKLNQHMHQYTLTQMKHGLFAALCFGTAWCVSAQTLAHRYSFNDPAGDTNFVDSVGGANGTLNNSTASDPTSAYLDGSQLQFDGNGGYANVPAGLISTNEQVTIEFWTSVNASSGVWTRIFAFGDQTGGGAENTGLDYTPNAGGNYENLNIQTPAGGGYANNNPGLDGDTGVHVTVVVDPVSNNMYYYNGVAVISRFSGTVPPLNGINDIYGLLGKSLADLDPPLYGSIDEFRIYSGVLPQSQVALNDATGPDTILTSPGTITNLSFSSPVNPLAIGQSVQQTLIGNFTLVTNVNMVAYGGVTYTSGNTNILTINGSGGVKGVSVGTTTVVATFGPVSATNSLTVVVAPTAIAHRYSFTSDASDSVGGANGTFEGDASVSGGQLVLDGGGYLSLPGSQINISAYPAATFEAWATIGNTPEWSHVFEFGNITVNNLYCAPRADADGFHEFGISEGGGVPGGQTLSWAHGWSNLTLHITAVVDPTTSTLSVYTNGVLQLASYTATGPLTSIGTNNATLGQSSYGDPDLIANIDEFRIYKGALTPAQVAMSDLSGPDSTNFNPGALASIKVIPTSYPAFGQLVAPVILVNYANLTNFNLLPNVYAQDTNLVVTSSDPTVISVNAQNMLTTGRPGLVTLSASYLGKASSATVRVQNQAVLAHRYSFANDDATNAVDSVGGANGSFVGTAAVSGGQLQLDGGSGDYVSLPPGLLATYESATMDIWATIDNSQQHWARLWEFADLANPAANEFYFAPAWNGGANAAFLSFGVPTGAANLGPQAPAMDQTVHLTCVVGDGELDLYTNAVPYLSASIDAPVSQAGIGGGWIGFSPYGDPGISGSVAEYRIYQGRLSLQEIQGSDALGPSQTLSPSPSRFSVSYAAGIVTLSWPVANAGFWVQTSSTLVSPSWVTVTNTPVLVGDSSWQVTVPASGGAQFFRLWR